MVVAARKPTLALKVVVPLWATLGFVPILVEALMLDAPTVVLELLDEGVGAGSGVKTTKESRKKVTPWVSRFVTVRVCCPLGRVGDPYASMVD